MNTSKNIFPLSILLAFLASVWLVTPLLAQDDNRYPDVGIVYLSLDPVERSQSLEVDAREPFTFYLILDIDEIEGFAPPYRLGAVGGQLRFAPEMFLTSITWISEWTLPFGEGLSPGVYDFQEALGSDAQSDGSPTVICTFEAILIEDVDDGLIEVAPPNSSDGWYDHFVFTVWDADFRDAPGFEAPFDPHTGALKINSTGLSSDSQSWGKVKALYRR